jgi:hypothetical protein
VALYSDYNANYIGGAVEGASGRLYLSTSGGSGSSFVAQATERDWRSIVVSYDGSLFVGVASDNLIYTSTDYGVVWTPRGGAARKYSDVAVSETGQYISATVYGGQIYVSSNYGLTWTAETVDRAWLSVSIYQTGSHQYAVVEFGQFHRDMSFGLGAWPALLPVSVSDFRSVSAALNGGIVIAVANNEDIWRTTNAGNTWTQIPSTARAWRCVSASYSEAVIIATAGDSGYVYTSTDSGLTWVQREAPGDYRACAVSGDRCGRIRGPGEGLLGGRNDSHPYRFWHPGRLRNSYP